MTEQEHSEIVVQFTINEEVFLKFYDILMEQDGDLNTFMKYCIMQYVETERKRKRKALEAPLKGE